MTQHMRKKNKPMKHEAKIKYLLSIRYLRSLLFFSLYDLVCSKMVSHGLWSNTGQQYNDKTYIMDIVNITTNIRGVVCARVQSVQVQLHSSILWNFLSTSCNTTTVGVTSKNLNDKTIFLNIYVKLLMLSYYVRLVEEEIAGCVTLVVSLASCDCLVVFCRSSIQCRGLDCSVWLWYIHHYI